MLPQFAWGASQNANAPPPTSPASQDANAQEHPYNGDDATRPLNLLQLRYTYKTAPGNDPFCQHPHNNAACRPPHRSFRELAA
jgi:hypothetical protein